MNKQTFDQLGLPPTQLENLASLGYLKMTEIQASTLPASLAGKDLLAQAKTGSGKTAAFSLPLLSKLNPRYFGVQGLILCPTRELATQVAQEVRRLARYQQNIKVVVLCGGQAIGPQIGSLEKGAHIIVGTPGRIKDHLRKETLSLDGVQTLVLDEADRMLEMGFVDDIAAIIEQTPSNRQTLFFSATYPSDIRKLSGRFQRSPTEVTVESLVDQQQIDQRFFQSDDADKLRALVKLLRYFQPDNVLVFCNTKEDVRAVCAQLNRQGAPVLALHGDLEQRDRDQVLVQFRQQSCTVLVATDVAARGLDITGLGAVINFDIPRDADTYIHRIGRTGRADESGLALTLLAESERYRLDRLGHFLERELKVESVGALPDGKEPFTPPPFVTLAIGGGRKQKVRPGDILGALTGSGGVAGTAVGRIDVMDYVAFVAIERHVANNALECLRQGKIKGRNLKVRQLS